MPQNIKTIFRKCLLLGLLFGAIAGIFIGILSIKINYLPLQFNNIILVPFYHSIIYVIFGLLVGLLIFVLIWMLNRIIPNGIQRRLNIILPSVFLLLILIFVFRVLWKFPAQKAKNTIVLEHTNQNPPKFTSADLLDDNDLLADTSPLFKTIIIALDAASNLVIDSLISDNQLPNIKHLIDNGVRANIKTLAPTRSPVIWTSIATGKLPEEHGIWDFVLSKLPGTSFTRGRYKYPYASGMEKFSTFFSDISFIPNIPYTSNLRKVKAFWNILSEHNRSVGVIGWYASFPAEDVNGIMVSDGLFYSSRYEDENITRSLTYPPTVFNEIKSILRDNTAFSDADMVSKFNLSEETWRKIKESKYFDDISYLLKLTLTRDERTIEITKKLLSEFGIDNFDLFSVYFKSLDEVSHAACEEINDEYLSIDGDYPICWENIQSAYKLADSRVGDILKYADDNTTFMIISDHGFSYGKMTGESRIGHWHAQDGVFILSGPNIKKNHELSDITILDILPTILFMQNLPVAIDMKGQVILSAFEKAFTETHPVKYLTSYDKNKDFSEKPVQTDINKEIEKKLKSLGYIK